jgi:aspartate dehydrogenase
MRRLGVIGCGAIGLPVIRAVRARSAGSWQIAGVLARHGRRLDDVEITDDPNLFFSGAFDLIIESGGPAALRQHGLRAIAAANVWSIGGAALADREFTQQLEQAARRSGHRLRLVPAAIAGLDGVAAAACDPDVILTLRIVEPSPTAGTFTGNARDAARLYPAVVNVAAAVAIAGPGLDATRVELRLGAPNERRVLALEARSKFGEWNISVAPIVDASASIHPVAASLIANLLREDRPIWAG